MMKKGQLSGASGTRMKYHWSADRDHKRCYGCEVSFSVFKWKHHCRQCGHIFCSKCAPESNQIVIPGFFDSKPVRHCNTCYANRSSFSREKHTKKVLKDMTGRCDSKERKPKIRTVNAPQLTAFKSYANDIYQAQQQRVRERLRKEFESFREDIDANAAENNGGEGGSSKEEEEEILSAEKIEKMRAARSVCLLKLSALAQICGEYRNALNYQKFHARMTQVRRNNRYSVRYAYVMICTYETNVMGFLLTCVAFLSFRCFLFSSHGVEERIDDTH